MPLSKLLEINLISAHDLPPLSATLRTFAVAYVSPDHKLTTKTDHHGHTNPSWNYKMLFHVPKDFLTLPSASLTVEIYNIARLRDLPIGTARLHLPTLSPPLTQNSGYRLLSLPICQPSGNLKGTLSLGIQLIDMDDDISLSSLRITDENSVANEKARISDENSVANEKFSVSDGMSISVANKNSNENRNGPDERPRPRPRPRRKKGMYDGDGAGYGSSILKNWTVGGSTCEGIPENVEEGKEMEIDQRWKRKSGLFKCFSNKFRLKKKVGNVDTLHHRSQSDGGLGKFYS
ncbi:uncharacterized protein LOC121781572 [Salvia splendens]|uniref:uncharacterized protein LOC121781572 n=1 Tax=Salvia splendens TaxID=180675 RepID=UPI001C25D41B|nr:uncharacterized protein LOC121781572 [Salvia splendens]